MAKKGKDPAAVALGRKSVKARMRNMTAEQRRNQARKAARARWHKAKPDAKPATWYGLLLLPADYSEDDRLGPMREAAKVIDAAYAQPEIALWSRDRNEIRKRAQAADIRDRISIVIDVDYDPTRFTITREYKPNVESQLKALRAVMAEAGEQQ